MNDNFDITTERRFPGQPRPCGRRGRRERPQARPDRFALWAVLLGVVAMFAGVASADGAQRESGAVSPQIESGSKTKAQRVAVKYRRIYARFKPRARRWARLISKCESGHNPKALSPDGEYRGAFQFSLETWQSAPRSPGGDPIDYTWKTQAVVAIALRNKARRAGWDSPWRVCSKKARKKLKRR